jgi:transcriptional regulator with XRE-family HTH domain
MLTKISLARAITHYRQQQGLSQREAAKACGIRHNTWNDLELAKANPRLSTLEAVANTLRVSIMSLFSPVLRSHGILIDNTENPES